MSYADLPLEERKRMATDFVLLLMDDELQARTQGELIRELQGRFYLSPQEALAAYLETMEAHAGVFGRLQWRQIIHTALFFFINLAVGLFYIIAGSRIIILPILGFVSFLASIILFFRLGKLLAEKLFFTHEELVDAIMNRKKKRARWDGNLLFWAAVAWSAAAWFYFEPQKKLRDSDLAEREGLVLAAPFEERWTVGKDRERYYLIRFQYTDAECGLLARYANFDTTGMLMRLRPGDPVNIWMLKAEEEGFLEGKATMIVDISYQGRRLIDLEAYSKAQSMDKGLFFWPATWFLLLSFLVSVGRRILDVRRERRQR
jgi:hypothetical protein